MHERTAKLEREIAEIRKQGRLDGEEARASLATRADEEAERIRKDAGEEIERRLAEAKAELRRTAADLTAAAATETLAREITPADRERLLADSVAQAEGRPMSSFTHPYARAFLEAAPPATTSRASSRPARRMANAFEANPALRAFLLAPNVPREAKSKAIAALAARVGLDEYGARFLQVMLRNHRLLAAGGRLQDPARPERPEAERPARAR